MRVLISQFVEALYMLVGQSIGVSKLIINRLSLSCLRACVECVLSVRVEANAEVDCLLNSNQRDVALQFSFG